MWRLLVSHLLTHTINCIVCIVVIAILVGGTCCPTVFVLYILIDWGFWASCQGLHYHFYVFFGKVSIWVICWFGLVICLTDVKMGSCIWNTDFSKIHGLKILRCILWCFPHSWFWGLCVQNFFIWWSLIHSFFYLFSSIICPINNICNLDIQSTI